MPKSKRSAEPRKCATLTEVVTIKQIRHNGTSLIVSITKEVKALGLDCDDFVKIVITRV